MSCLTGQQHFSTDWKPGEAPGKSSGTQGWGTGRGECLSFLFFLCPDVTGVFYLMVLNGHVNKREHKSECGKDLRTQSANRRYRHSICFPVSNQYYGRNVQYILSQINGWHSFWSQALLQCYFTHWTLVNSQSCAGFRRSAKWASHTDTCILLLFSNSFPFHFLRLEIIAKSLAASWHKIAHHP